MVGWLAPFGFVAGVALFGAGSTLSGQAQPQVQQAPQGSAFTPGKALGNPAVDVYVATSAVPGAASDDCFASKDSVGRVLLRIPTQLNLSGANAPYTLLPAGAKAEFRGSGSTASCRPAGNELIIAIVLKTVPPAANFKDDAVKLDPAHNKVLMENDFVRVVQLHFPPGESGPIVDKRYRVITALTTSHAMVTVPDGRSRAADMNAGTIVYSAGGRQATLNAGTGPLDNIVTEFKGK
jgi:hypothetical protein